MENLIEVLLRADEAYTLGSPIMSDTEYDKLRSKAKEFFPNDPYFNLVGSKVKNGKKVKLPYVLGSLNKVKLDDIDKWLFSLRRKEILASYKLDGCSIYVEYNRGKVTFASTRGDGDEGTDITEKAKIFCPTIAFNGTLHLRGEVLLTGDKHLQLGLKNRRNGVAGLLNRDDLFGCEFLSVKFYEYINSHLLSESDRLKTLQNFNLPIVDFMVLPIDSNTKIQLIEFLEKSKTLDFDCDGLVLTDEISTRENVMHPINKVAFKVNEDAQAVNVESIEWNVTRTGRIVPVVCITPTEMQGVVISRATGFNAKFIEDNRIKPGAKIGVVRSGDVIPFITENFDIEKISPDEKFIPSVCPNCGDDVEFKGVDIRCLNKNCGSRDIQMVEYFFRTLGGEKLTSVTLAKLGISKIPLLYELTKEQILATPGFKDRMAEIIISEIKKTLKTKPDVILAAFGIEGLGVKNAKKLIDWVMLNKKIEDPFVIMEFIFNSLKPGMLMSIDGFGEKSTEKILSELPNFKSLYQELLAYGLEFEVKRIAEKSSSSTISGMKIALTGSGPMKRSELEEKLVSLGCEVGSVTKQTNYLVCEDPSANSSKLEKARKLGVQIISYSELLTMI